MRALKSIKIPSADYEKVDRMHLDRGVSRTDLIGAAIELFEASPRKRQDDVIRQRARARNERRLAAASAA